MSRSLPKPCQTGSIVPCVDFFSLDLERLLGGQPLANGKPQWQDFFESRLTSLLVTDRLCFHSPTSFPHRWLPKKLCCFFTYSSEKTTFILIWNQKEFSTSYPSLWWYIVWELYSPTCLYLQSLSHNLLPTVFLPSGIFVSPIPPPYQPNNFVIVLKDSVCLFSGDFLYDFTELLCSLLKGMLFWRFIGEDYCNPRD